MKLKRIATNIAIAVVALALIVGVIVGLFCIVHSVIVFDFGLLFIGLGIAGASYGLLQAMIYFSIMRAFG